MSDYRKVDVSFDVCLHCDTRITTRNWSVREEWVDEDNVSGVEYELDCPEDDIKEDVVFPEDFPRLFLERWRKCKELRGVPVPQELMGMLDELGKFRRIEEPDVLDYKVLE